MAAAADNDDGARSLSSSPSPSPSPVRAGPTPPRRTPTRTPPRSSSATAAVTVAASSHPHPHHQTLTLALPIQTPSPAAASSASSAGGRDDCWSEGATSALIDAWGERYLDLNRGSLKQNHWQEVADAVSARDDYTKPPKSGAQCKNRIDTIKKKYRSERSKISSGQSHHSTWPFFHRLDILIGPNFLKPPAAPPAFPPQFPQKTRTQTVINSTIRSSNRARSPNESDGLPPAAPPPAQPAEEGDGLRELTRAITRFGEVYERVERAKAQGLMEAEKQRMGFVREVELQRMQFFINAQMELSQLGRRHSDKRSRVESGYDHRRSHRRNADNGNEGENNSE